MNILFYSSYFFPYISGITVYTEKIAHHFTKKNLVTILTFQYDKSLPINEKKGEIGIIRMPYLFKISKGFISPSSLITFINKTRQNDVIFITLPNIEGLFLALCARLYKKQLITIFHCEIDLGKGFINSMISSFVSFVGFIQMLLSDTVVGYEDYLQSRWFYKYIKHKCRTSFPPIQKIPFDSSYYAHLLKQKGDTRWVGFVGRISREKGIEYLINAVAQATKEDKKIKLILVGPYGKNVAGEETYYKTIKQLLDTSKISYQFFSTLPRNELGAMYKALDVLVTPSINKTEAFGMSQAEAMLMGTPVIATNLPGVRQPILKTGMGKIVPLKNSFQLSETIKDILAHRSSYTSLQKIKDAENIFDEKKVYAFYDGLLA